MSSDKKDTASIEYVGFGFTLEEATKHMHQEVMLKTKKGQNQNLKNIGLVLGILHLNEEIELVVQFYEKAQQFTKSEFESQLDVIS
ncbi:hypothetical protein A3765_08430 [Oleiphilus sp. HI0130]|nr:hypothetical protein A3765_08430 [Oleiphilus sp. HI0130]